MNAGFLAILPFLTMGVNGKYELRIPTATVYPDSSPKGSADASSILPHGLFFVL
jgi:hypothetical protein